MLQQQQNQISQHMQQIEDRLFIVCEHDWTEDVSVSADAVRSDDFSVCKHCGCASESVVSRISAERKRRQEQARLQRMSPHPVQLENDTRGFALTETQHGQAPLHSH